MTYTKAGLLSRWHQDAGFSTAQYWASDQTAGVPAIAICSPIPSGLKTVTPFPLTGPTNLVLLASHIPKVGRLDDCPTNLLSPVQFSEPKDNRFSVPPDREDTSIRRQCCVHIRGRSRIIFSLTRLVEILDENSRCIILQSQQDELQQPALAPTKNATTSTIIQHGPCTIEARRLIYSSTLLCF